MEYDGFFFTPNHHGEGLELSFFNHTNSEYINSAPIENTKFGDKFHIAFFKPNDKGNLEFDDSFEAIFGDPVTYIKNLEGANLFGCILRKTTQSGKWFNNYLTKAKENVTIQNMNLKKGN